MRSLMGKLNKFALAPGSLSDIGAAGTPAVSAAEKIETKKVEAPKKKVVIKKKVVAKKDDDEEAAPADGVEKTEEPAAEKTEEPAAEDAAVQTDDSLTAE
jgi:hypothetical protein